MPADVSGEPASPPSGRNRATGPRDLDWAAISSVLKQHLRSGSRGATTDAVTDALREGIVDGTLPPGTWMREEDLANALEVSRTPVRESLRRLSDEHLLRRTANRGSIVEAMTIDDVSAIYDVREVLEGLAVHTVTSRLPHGLLGSLVEIHEALIEATNTNDTAQEVKLNVDFHRAIRAGTGNAYLIQFLERAENVVRRSGVTIYSSPERLARNVAEHGALIEAIASGDANRARDVAIEHMRRAREARIRALLGQLGQPQAPGTDG